MRDTIALKGCVSRLGSEPSLSLNKRRSDERREQEIAETYPGEPVLVRNTLFELGRIRAGVRS